MAAGEAVGGGGAGAGGEGAAGEGAGAAGATGGEATGGGGGLWFTRGGTSRRGGGASLGEERTPSCPVHCHHSRKARSRAPARQVARRRPVGRRVIILQEGFQMCIAAVECWAGTGALRT